MTNKKIFRTHLADVVALHGEGPLNRALLAMLGSGLASANASKDAAYKERRPEGKQNPSASDALKCPRRVWATLKHLPETNPPDMQSLGNFAFGHAIEAEVGRLLVMSGAKVIDQPSFSIHHEGTFISGRADFLVLAEGAGLVEVKCTNAENVEWNIKRGDFGSAEHKAQLNLYLHAYNNGYFGTYDDDGKRLAWLAYGTLLYVVPNAKKGEPNYFPWRVDYNRAAAIDAMDDLAAVARAEVMPGIPEGYKPSAYPCSYCPFFSACWEAGFALADKGAA